MRQGRRHGLSAEQKADIWRLWKAGESLHAIGRAFDKNHGSIQFLLAQHGGIAPAVRCRSQRTLTLAEREEISREIVSGSSIREIAGGLGRAASTVSREVARRGGRPVYLASEADQRAWKLALRPKALGLQSSLSLRCATSVHLASKYDFKACVWTGEALRVRVSIFLMDKLQEITDPQNQRMAHGGLLERSNF